MAAIHQELPGGLRNGIIRTLAVPQQASEVLADNPLNVAFGKVGSSFASQGKTPPPTSAELAKVTADCTARKT